MTAASPAAIARAFVTARQQATGFSDYPGPIPPSLADGYAIQAEALTLVDAPVGGWKVGRVPVPLVDRFGADRLAGPIFAPTIHAITADAIGRVFAQGFGAAEAEFLLRIGRAPDPAQKSFSLNEAAALVDAVHIGLEIASSPFTGINDHGPAVTVSDFGNNNGLLIGAAVADWQSLAFADIDISLSIDGAVAGTGRAASFPDGPIGSVRFLLENLAARGIALHPGTWISTGAVTGVHEVRVGQNVVADFGPLGVAQCMIRPQAAA